MSVGVGMFHPTWDEWKQRAKLSNEKTNKSKHESVSTKHTNTFNKQHQEDCRNNMIESNQTKSSKSSYITSQEYYSANDSSSHQMTTTQDKTNVYNPPSPILIRNANTNQLEYVNESSMRRQQQHRSPRHYPVAGIDFLPMRPPSPVELSSCTLAKKPGLEIQTENESKEFKKTESVTTVETKPIVLENIQQKKIKTILSTRKESAPNLTGWRTESDSDSDVQNRLLARASGSIPIEYISIRRDPKPDDKQANKNKKSITTGTNTSSDRGKKIAATNTNQDELPQYNLHVSLDSLLVKSRQEASTTTELKNKNASTETSFVGHKDAGTLTDAEKSPSPPPPPPPAPKIHSEPKKEEVVYTQRKSRYTEWQTSPPNPPIQQNYRLEILAKSPSTNQSRQFYRHHHEQSFVNREPPIRKTSLNYSINQTVRVDDDDRIVFGKNRSSYDNSHYYQESVCRRSGSFPCLFQSRPVVVEKIFDSTGGTRKYVKQSTFTQSNYSPQFIVEQVTYNNNITQPHYELGMMPLITNKQSFDFDWNSQFTELNNKFKQVFGNQMANTSRRYYKYSRTSTDMNNNQSQSIITEPIMFGSQQQQQQNQQSYAYSKLNSYSSGVNASSSTSSRGPIVEIPVTPTSTIRKSSNNGPIITSMSRNGSASNLNSSFCMTSSFEPVVKRVSSTKVTTSTSSSSGRARHEEDEQFVGSMKRNVDTERQFKPINETISRESHFRSTSSNGNAVPLIQTNATRNSSFNSGSSARQNFSSSYEYSSSSKKIN